MSPAGETLSDSNQDTSPQAGDAGSDYPAFDPDNAQRLRSEARDFQGEAEDTAEQLEHGPIGAITYSSS